MLTLKSPLRLTSIHTLPVTSNQMAEKIIGNYQIMNISISPQDLLHMTTLAPEVYVGMATENSFITENKIRQTNEIKYEVINQLMNRILLYQTPQFTYQDEVYVATICQKLGIRNITEFMEQIRRSAAQNEQTIRLLEQYYEKGVFLREQISAVFSEKKIRELLAPQEMARTMNENYFSNEIYHRLQTAEYSNTVYDYHMQFHRDESYQQEEMSFIRQSWYADQIQLARLKEQIYTEWKTPAVWRENRYEQRTILPEQITEKNVLTQLSAAILTDLIQNIFYFHQNRNIGKTYIWQDFSKALNNSAIDVIARFEDFHTNIYSYEEEIHQLDTLIQKLNDEEMLLLDSVSYETDEYAENMYQPLLREVILTLLQNQNLQQQMSENRRVLQTLSVQSENNDQNIGEMVQFEELDRRGRILSEIRESSRNIFAETVYRYREEIEGKTIEQREENRNREISDFSKLVAAGEKKKIVQTSSEKSRIENLKGENLFGTAELFYAPLYPEREEDKSQSSDQVNGKTEGKRADQNEKAKEAKSFAFKEAVVVEESQSLFKEQVEKLKQQDRNEDNRLESAELFHMPTYFETEEDYIQYLNQMNEKNIKIYKQIIAAQPKRQSIPQQISLERKSAGKLALRALSEPEEVLKEIYEKGNEIVSSDFREITRTLQYTDERTRQFYLKLMDIAQTPETKEAKEQIREIYETFVRGETHLTASDDEETGKFQQAMELLHDGTIYEETVEEYQIPMYEQKNYRMEKRVGKSFLQRYEELLEEQTQNQKLMEVYREIRQEWLLHKEQIIGYKSRERQIQNMKENMTEELEAVSKQFYVYPQIELEEAEQLDMIHYTVWQEREELAEEIRNSLQQEIRQTQNHEEIVHTEEIVEKHVTEVKKELMQTTQSSITELIRQNLRTQVESISEQVYQDIEKRLNRERRRRGY